jgi:Cu/Ag efflux protein CusF
MIQNLEARVYKLEPESDTSATMIQMPRAVAILLTVRGTQAMITILSAIASACLGLTVACGPSRSAKQTDAEVATTVDETSVKRYPLSGRVVSVDKADRSISVDGDEVPGFMAAMTMPYKVKDASLLDKVAPGNQIKAEIVVGNKGAYLENIVIAPRTP